MLLVMPGLMVRCLWQIGSQLGDRLAAYATSSNVNLSMLSASSLANTFLPKLLPAAWKGQRLVARSQEDSGTGITADWLKLLWARLSDFPDLSTLAQWPLVPVKGNNLCQGDPASQVPSSICHNKNA